MRYEPGHKPWNTGKKFSLELRMKLRLAHLGKKQNKETRIKISIAHKGTKIGEKNPMWKGGKLLDGKGYIKILVKNHPFRQKENYVREHRLVMEKHLGRYLNNKEVIHHINGNKEDNRIENLMLFDNNTKHLNYHKKLRQIDCGEVLIENIK